MNTFKKMFLTIPLMLIVLLVNRYGELYAQPTSGDWKAPTEFGEFIFTVNTAGTYITRLEITHNNWTCGGVTQNGTVIKQSSPGWPISGNQFTIETNIDPSGNITITINGTFNQAGNEASGTWSENVYGTICSGNWGPVGPVSSIEETGRGIPVQFVLAQNYPNPFNPITKINYEIPQPTGVRIEIFNIIGKKIITLINDQIIPGYHHVMWNGENEIGKPVTAGVYICRMQAGTIVQIKKMILLK